MDGKTSKAPDRPFQRPDNYVCGWCQKVCSLRYTIHTQVGKLPLTGQKALAELSQAVQ
jgi:hypothetical protein